MGNFQSETASKHSFSAWWKSSKSDYSQNNPREVDDWLSHMAEGQGLCVAERFLNATTVCSQKVVSHVRMEVEIFSICDKVSGLGSHLELFVIPVDNADSISFTICQISWQVTSDSCPEERRDPSCWW